MALLRRQKPLRHRTERDRDAALEREGRGRWALGFAALTVGAAPPFDGAVLAVPLLMVLPPAPLPVGSSAAGGLPIAGVLRDGPVSREPPRPPLDLPPLPSDRRPPSRSRDRPWPWPPPDRPRPNCPPPRGELARDSMFPSIIIPMTSPQFGISRDAAFVVCISSSTSSAP